jgi:cytochrome oxidase Cu insertion factor (SCO1/SenC/PrrC family)
MTPPAELSAAPRGARPSGLVIAVVLSCALLVGLGAGVLLRGSGAHTNPAAASAPFARGGLYGQATWAAGARPAPPITTLVDQSGRPFSLASLRGHTVAIAFFDSYCNQSCPLEGRALASAERALARAQRPVLVAVSVNPRDTPASTRSAIRRWGLAGVGPWHWLRGTHRQLAAVWKAYHIFVAPPVDGDITHTEAVYLVDRSGDERSAYLYPFATRFVAHDLTTLAAGGRS